MNEETRYVPLTEEQIEQLTDEQIEEALKRLEEQLEKEKQLEEAKYQATK